MNVWYHAGYDHIFVRVSRSRIELGCQGSNTIEFEGKKISVPDWLSLFTWKVGLGKWKEHLDKGWLVCLGEL